MSSDITPDSRAMLCKLVKDAIQINPEARPVVMSLIDMLMDNQVPQEQWGQPILTHIAEDEIPATPLEEFERGLRSFSKSLGITGLNTYFEENLS